MLGLSVGFLLHPSIKDHDIFIATDKYIDDRCLAVGRVKEPLSSCVRGQVPLSVVWTSLLKEEG